MRIFAELFDSMINDAYELDFRLEQISEIWKRFDYIQLTTHILYIENESIQSEERELFECSYHTSRSLFQYLIKNFAISAPETIHNLSVGHPTFD